MTLRRKTRVVRLYARRAHFGLSVALAGMLLLCGSLAQAVQEISPAVGVQDVQQPNISGKVVDANGVAIAGATIQLSRKDGTANRQAISNSDGAFTFDHVAPGPFHLTVSAAEFTTQEYSGNINSTENLTVPAITLRVATLVTEVRVVPP